MNTSLKKALLLIRSVLSHIEDTDPIAQRYLNEMIAEIKGEEEWKWVNELVKKDKATAEKRSLEELNTLGESISEQERLDLISVIWREQMRKGYLSNREAQWLLSVARVWRLDQKLLRVVDESFFSDTSNAIG